MIIQELPLVIQTAYAELLDQLKLAKVDGFPPQTSFRKRTIHGKDYWYAQAPSTQNGQPPERYIGVDTPELANIIHAGQQAKQDANRRKIIIQSLRGVRLPSPDSITEMVLDALSVHGFFRLRGVLVGTAAFQCYAGILGVIYPNALVRTGDLDIATDYGVSVALDDSLDKPLLDILQTVDKGFRSVPALDLPFATASYVNPNGYRLDVLTTNRGKSSETPVFLPSLKTDALPLRHLDYLLQGSIEAAVLSKYGVLVNVPSPERYAVHKLMLSTMRRGQGGNPAKANKDLAQAVIIMESLRLKHRALDFKEAYTEARDRGVSWQKKLTQAESYLSPEQQALLRQLLDT
jgi:hypothetical protein